MAIVTRIYQDVGPAIPADFAKYVSAGTPPAVAGVYGRTTVGINYDNAVAGLVDDLDTFMAALNLAPSATASPDQVFEYTCTGAEGASFAIGNAQGFVTRATVNYVVQLTICKPNGNAFKLYNIRDGSKAVNGFTVDVSAAVEAGDMLCFTVQDKT